MKKIGIMGGTFNPIHIGHIQIAKAAKECYDLDGVLFMPSGISYLKKNLRIASAETRTALTALAIEDEPDFILSTLETERGGNTYTDDTLRLLKKMNPDTEYYFIIGADTLFTIETWRSPQDIFRLCVILVTVRGDKDKQQVREKILQLEDRFRGDIRIIHMKPVEVSSTMIRERIARGESIEGLVPEKVRNYIELHGLYQ